MDDYVEKKCMISRKFGCFFFFSLLIGNRAYDSSVFSSYFKRLGGQEKATFPLTLNKCSLFKLTPLQQPRFAPARYLSQIYRELICCEIYWDSYGHYRGLWECVNIAHSWDPGILFICWFSAHSCFFVVNE